MAVLKPLAANFFRFDFLIILTAVGAGFLYWRCLQSCVALRRILMPRANLALGEKERKQINAHFNLYLDPKGEKEILNRRMRMNSLYAFFLNVCAVFPLLGLQGTVVSLIPMVDSMQTELFFSALTSTFWGIVFAIIFKALNGWLEAMVEENTELVNTYLLRIDAARERRAGGGDAV